MRGHVGGLVGGESAPEVERYAGAAHNRGRNCTLAVSAAVLMTWVTSRFAVVATYSTRSPPTVSISKRVPSADSRRRITSAVRCNSTKVVGDTGAKTALTPEVRPAKPPSVRAFLA